MRERPPIGARVRILGNVGWGDFKGKRGTVVRHHVDGVCFFVQLDDDPKGRRPLGLDPVNVQLIDSGER